MPQTDSLNSKFKEKLQHLINSHSIENVSDMPDFIMADMICGIIAQVGIASKRTLDWHGCDSVCHPKKGSDKYSICNTAPYPTCNGAEGCDTCEHQPEE